MDLEAIKEVLSKDENGKKIYDAVVGMIQAEKTRGIEEVRKVNSEAKGLRERFKEPLVGLGLNLETPEWVDQLRAWKEKSEGGAKQLTEWEQRYNELAKRTSETEGYLKKLEEEKQAAIQKHQRGLMRDALKTKLEGKIYGLDATVTALISEGAVSVGDGDNVYFMQEGKQVALDEGVESLLKSGKVDLKPVDTKGTGSPGGGDGKPAPQTYTRPRQVWG